jgi:cytidylate kinase
MAIITISRGTFSGGVMLAERLAACLGYRCLDRDTLVRKAAAGRVTEFDLRAALEEPPEYPGRLNHRRYIYLALIQAALWEEVRRGYVVYHGLAGHLLLKGAPGILRLRIIAPLESRIRMAGQRLGLDREQAVARIGQLDRDRRKWTQFLYGLDWGNPALYDLVINLDRLTLEQACSLVAATVAQSGFEVDTESQRIRNDFALAARVRKELAINIHTLNLEMDVEASGGRISLRGEGLEDDWHTIESVVLRVPGVNGCQFPGAAGPDVTAPGSPSTDPE